MIEKGKLSFWDVGTYLMIGFLSTFVFSVSLVWKSGLDWSGWIEVVKSISGLLVVILPIWFLLLGMFVEPVANMVCKWLEKIPLLEPKKSHHQEYVVGLVSKLLPDEELRTESPYRFCKSVVELKYPNSNHEIFLARFGFYRSLGFVFFVSSSMSFFVLGCGLLSLSVAIICAILGVVFLRRSQVFLSHMSDAVYFNYAALAYEKSILKSSKE